MTVRIRRSGGTDALDWAGEGVVAGGEDGRPGDVVSPGHRQRAARGLDRARPADGRVGVECGGADELERHADSEVKAPPVLVPPPVRNRLPVWTSTVPDC